MKKFENFKEEIDDKSIVKLDNNDPYNEEKWGDDDDLDIQSGKNKYSHLPGVCYNCGSDNLDYGQTEFFDNSIGYEYTCYDCKSIGMEVYDLVFVINEES